MVRRGFKCIGVIGIYRNMGLRCNIFQGDLPGIVDHNEMIDIAQPDPFMFTYTGHIRQYR